MTLTSKKEIYLPQGRILSHSFIIAIVDLLAMSFKINPRGSRSLRKKIVSRDSTSTKERTPSQSHFGAKKNPTEKT